MKVWWRSRGNFRPIVSRQPLVYHKNRDRPILCEPWLWLNSLIQGFHVHSFHNVWIKHVCKSYIRSMYYMSRVGKSCWNLHLRREMNGRNMCLATQSTSYVWVNKSLENAFSRTRWREMERSFSLVRGSFLITFTEPYFFSTQYRYVRTSLFVFGKSSDLRPIKGATYGYVAINPCFYSVLLDHSHRV